MTACVIKTYGSLFLYNKIFITNNISVNNVLVWLSAIGFLIAVFPVYVQNYVYIDSQNKYASVNICIFRYFRLVNINTVKNSLDKMQINGKEKKLDFSKSPPNFYKIFNNLCIKKIVQVSSYGLQGEGNATVALLQTNLTNAVYTFVRANGGRTKLKNYVLLDLEHEHINYYLKIVSVINLIVIFKIIFLLILEKMKNVKT